MTTKIIEWENRLFEITSIQPESYKPYPTILTITAKELTDKKYYAKCTKCGTRLITLTGFNTAFYKIDGEKALCARCYNEK